MKSHWNQDILRLWFLAGNKKLVLIAWQLNYSQIKTVCTISNLGTKYARDNNEFKEKVNVEV